MLKKFYKYIIITALFFCYNNTFAVDINYNDDYINGVYTVPASWSGILIYKKEWYNFFITHIDLSNNCSLINCNNASFYIDMIDSDTWTGGEWLWTVNGQTISEYESKVNLLFKNDLLIKNLNSEHIVYIRLEWYYLKDNATSYDLFNTTYNILTSDRWRQLRTLFSILLFNFLLFWWTVRLWFRLWRDYLIFKKEKWKK